MTIGDYNLRADHLLIEEDIDQPKELDLGQCWRDDCYQRVPRSDDVGLCAQCLAELRDL